MTRSRLGRWVFVALAVLTAAALASVLVLRQALSGGALRAAAESRLSAMLGEPVAIGDVGVTLFPASLSGTGIRVGSARTAAPAVTIARIRILPRLWSLVRGPIVVDEVRLDGFSVSVLRDRQGRWRVPAAMPAPGTDDQGSIVIHAVTVTNGRLAVFDALADDGVREAGSIDDIEADVGIAADGLRFAPITGRAGASRITGEARTEPAAAHFQFKAEGIANDDLPRLLGLLGAERPDFLKLSEPATASVTLRIDRAKARLSGKGSVTAPHVLVEPLTLRQFEAPFTIDGSRLVYDPTVFTVADGTHRGKITIDLAASPARWGLDSRVDALDIGDFLKTLTAGDARLDGTAAVNAALTGRIGETLMRSVNGRTRLTVVNGVVRQFPLLAYINRALRLAEGDGADTRFERLSASLQIGGGRATTDDLLMEAAHLRVRASGAIGFDRSLDLRGHAILSSERSAQAIRSVRELTGLRNSSGELEIPLTIGGTLDAPDFGLDLKAAIGKGIKDELMRRFRRIIRAP